MGLQLGSLKLGATSSKAKKHFQEAPVLHSTSVQSLGNTHPKP